MRNRWPSPSLDGNKKVNIEIETDKNDGSPYVHSSRGEQARAVQLRENQKECLEILTGTSGRENFELVRRAFFDELISFTFDKLRVRGRRFKSNKDVQVDNLMDPMQMLGNIAVRQCVEAEKLTIIWECEGTYTRASQRRVFSRKDDPFGNYAERAAFSDAELLDVLTGIDAGGVQGCVSGPSINVVLSEDVLSSEQVFENFMESLGSDDDVGVLRASDGSLSRIPAPPLRLHQWTLTASAKGAPLPRNDATHDRAATDCGENARLRQLVREQVKSVKAIQRTLDKTPDLSKMGIAPECSALNGMTQCQSRTSKDLYRELFKNISSSYSSGVGNLLLQQPCMPAPSLVGKRKMNMEMETDGECGPQMCLQFVESRLIPCSLLRIGTTPGTFCRAQTATKTFRWYELAILGNIAVRRYYESNKLTFVWECDGLCSHDGAASSMHVHQKGWYANFTAIPFTDSAKAVGQTTEIVIENYEKTVVYIFDAVLASLACEAPHSKVVQSDHLSIDCPMMIAKRSAST
ncbi:hypothetical protein GQ600_11157 [Phytophthora cactorum]|nr:hypothetical protein GQ600_11157 [Phytophthora cactorum]